MNEKIILKAKRRRRRRKSTYVHVVRVFLLLYSRAPTTYLVEMVEMVEMMVREETRRLRGGAFV